MRFRLQLRKEFVELSRPIHRSLVENYLASGDKIRRPGQGPQVQRFHLNN